MNKVGIFLIILIICFFVNGCTTMNEDRITNTKTFSDIYFSHSDRTLSRDIWYVEGEKLLIMFDYNPAGLGL
jgi:hypothetical protein